MKEDDAPILAVDENNIGDDSSLSKRKKRKYRKIRKKLLEDNDIKYKGILSYRHLRIIAWIAIACSQIILLNTNIIARFAPEMVFPTGAALSLNLIGALSTPMFLIASFGQIMNDKKSIGKFLILYGASYLAMFVGITVLYRRYILNLSSIFISDDSASNLFANVLGDRIEFNIFCDLFFLTSFYFFLTYTPKRHFKGKKLYAFRSLCLIPVLCLGALYTIKSLSLMDIINLPFELHALLCTKSPFVHIIFYILSLWLKNKKRLFHKVGGTVEQYKSFSDSNRNSLTFSFKISILFVIFAIIDLALFMILGSLNVSEKLISSLGVGYCMGLLLAIPIIMLYSFKKTYKNNTFDLILPFVGVALIAIVYIESFYQLAIHLASK